MPIIRKWAVTLTCVLTAACSTASTSPSNEALAAGPFGQMEVAFDGNYSQEEIKPRLDQAMRLYGLPRTDENYSRAGSVLVTMRKEIGPTEMQILDYMIRSHVDEVEFDFVDAAALAATFLAAGDN